MTTPTSRSVTMISRSYNTNPVIDARPRWYWCMRSSFAPNMKKLIPWLLGIVIGIMLSGAIGLVLLVAGAFVASDKILDNGYSIIAVSWGSYRGQTAPLIYQARVSVSDGDGDGVLDVRSIVYIGSGMYQHDMGIIGRATSHDDAIQRFGKVSWTDSELLIAGTEGIQWRLSRSSLESHR